ncbi:MAG: hemerythrin domain-containing protein [Coriobacteriia bacterium]
MTGTEDLRSEHRAVGRMLDIMDEVAVSLRRGELLNAEDLSGVVEFLRVFVDKCHHSKEEQLLFPAMRAGNSAGTEDVIADLLADHARGRDAVSRIVVLVPSLNAADESAMTGLAEAINGYTQLLRAHIVREERDCFDSADRELSSAVQEQLNEGYERIEVEVVGGGVHEVFHALLDRLSQAYHV